MTQKFLLTPDSLSPGDAACSVASAAAGGLVLFIGTVRDRARGREVTKLEYDAYPEMVESIFEQIAGEAKARFAIRDVAIYHRTGALEVGEISVVVAVSAEHRHAAFDACRYVIDRLKADAPIWKKEFSPDGTVWVEERP